MTTNLVASVREGNRAESYTYDVGGNMVSRKEYDYTDSSIITGMLWEIRSSIGECRWNGNKDIS